jgi:hypothetical protein
MFCKGNNYLAPGPGVKITSLKNKGRIPKKLHGGKK